MVAVFGKAAVAHPGEVHPSFERCEHALHFGADGGDEAVVALLSGGKRGAAAPAFVHDARLDARRPQSLSARALGIGLVALKRRFIAAHKPVGRDGIIDVRRGQHKAADQPAALVCADVELIAIMEAALVDAAARAFACRYRSVGIDRLARASGRAGAEGRGDQRRIDHRALLHNQPARLQLALERGK